MNKLSGDALAKAWGKAMGTDRKQFDMFFDRMLDGFAYHKVVVDKAGNPVDYVFLEVNHAFEKMTGLKRERIIGKRVTAILPGIEKDPADWIGVYGKVALTGEPVQFENHAEPLGKWFKVIAYCPEKGHFVALSEDITERKKAEEALRVSEEKANALIKYAPTGIYEIDYRIPKFKSVNDAMCSILGYTREELLAMSPFALLDDESKVRFRERIMKLLAGEKVAETVEFKVKRKDGREIYAVLNVMFTYKDGKPESAVVIAHDVTERKKAEEELSKLNEELEERVRKRTEQVSSERQRLYNVLETLPAYVVLLDKDYRVPFANKIFRERFGESHGRRCHEYLFKRDLPCENCETYKVLKTNGPHHWEWTGPDSRDYDIYDFPFVEADGSTLILEMGIDITERKRAEKRVRDVSFYSRSLIEASLDPLVTINVEGKITDVNQATEIATGCSKEELIGSDFSDYFTEPEKAEKGYKQVFTEGFVRDYPLAIRNKSGKIIDVLYNAAIYTNEAGEMQGVFAAARDITERKKAEEQYRILFDSIDEGFCIIEMVFNSDGKPSDYLFLEVNSSFERQTGIHDAKGKLMRSFAPNHEAYWFEIYGKVALTGKPIRFTNEARALNRWYDVFAFPVGEEKIRKVGILFNDITQRMNLEKQLKDSERLAAIGATAGMVGHDIRNPLQGMTSDVYLAKTELASTPESEEKKNALESLDEIQKNIDYVNKIVADLQDYARRLKPVAKETNVQKLIDELLTKNGLPKNIKVQVKLQKEAETMLADSDILKRILGNLVTNAVQAMPEGGKLSIHTCKEANDLVITVADTGVGIPEEAKERLFTPLFTTKSKGQGFGLAVVKRMTESLGGTVTFKSEQGKGTKFIIRLPQTDRR